MCMNQSNFKPTVLGNAFKLSCILKDVYEHKDITLHIYLSGNTDNLDKEG